MRPSPAPVRSRTRGARTGTGPRPVMIARSGRWPWRTSRWRPSSVCLSAWPLRKAATSASTACASRARAPSRRTSVSGSENSAGWISLTTLSWIMACHSFGGEVEARTPPRYAASTPHAVTNFRAYLQNASRRILPKCNQQLARQGDDHRLAETTARALDPRAEPQGQRGLRLMPQPQPGNLDHDRSQPGITGLGDALVPMDRSALPRRGGQSGIGGNLLSVVERAEQAFRPERGGRLGSNASQCQQQSRWRWHAGARLRLGQPGIPLGFDSLDLFDHEFEPIEFPADLGL